MDCFSSRVALKEYFKLYPEGFGAEDVYVCESRYSAKSKSFKKIKMWTMPLSSVRFLPRDVPLPVVRVASMFAVKPEEKPAEALDEEKMEEANVDKVNLSLSPALFWVQGCTRVSWASTVCSVPAGEGGRSPGRGQRRTRLPVLRAALLQQLLAQSGRLCLHSFTWTGAPPSGQVGELISLYLIAKCTAWECFCVLFQHDA